MSKKRLLLLKTFKVFTLTSSLVLTIFSNTRKNTSLSSLTIPYTDNDAIHNLQFSEELEDILKISEIKFKNQELERIVKKQAKKQHTTVENLDTLVIEEALRIQDFSDLKYLTHLKYLSIAHNLINLEDIQYNQELEQLQLKNSQFYHTFAIPNTVYDVDIYDSTCLDNRLVLPYNSTRVSLTDSRFCNLTLRCPENLEDIAICGNVILDLNIFKNSYHLRRLAIFDCPNVLHKEVLTHFLPWTQVILDDYAPIWLDSETINNMYAPIHWKAKYEEEVSNLDVIAEKLVSAEEQISDGEKIKRITLYVLNKLKYDEVVLNGQDDGTRTKAYNREPIHYALESDEVVCINYASLFQALANRLGLDSYQVDNYTHAWNIVKNTGDTRYLGYDLTNLDVYYPEISNGGRTISNDSTEDVFQSEEKDNLFFYAYDLSDTTYKYITDRIYLLQDLENMVVDMGYIKDYYKIFKIKIGNEEKIFYVNHGNIYAFLLAIFGMLSTSLIRKEEIAYNIEKIQKKRKLEDEDSQSIKVLTKRY